MNTNKIIKKIALTVCISSLMSLSMVEFAHGVEGQDKVDGQDGVNVQNGAGEQNGAGVQNGAVGQDGAGEQNGVGRQNGVVEQNGAGGQDKCEVENGLLGVKRDVFINLGKNVAERRDHKKVDENRNVNNVDESRKADGDGNGNKTLIRNMYGITGESVNWKDHFHFVHDMNPAGWVRKAIESCKDIDYKEELVENAPYNKNTFCSSDDFDRSGRIAYNNNGMLVVAYDYNNGSRIAYTTRNTRSWKDINAEDIENINVENGENREFEYIFRIKYIKGKFVAFSYANDSKMIFIVSDNGTKWKTYPNKGMITDIVYNYKDDKFYGVSKKGPLYAGKNLMDLIKAEFNVNDHTSFLDNFSLCLSPQGILVGYTRCQVYLNSGDANHEVPYKWDKVFNSPYYSCSHVIHNGSCFLSIRRRSLKNNSYDVCTSQDGKNWTKTETFNASYAINVINCDGYFVISVPKNKKLTEIHASRDGTNWKKVTDIKAEVKSIFYSEGQFYIFTNKGIKTNNLL